ncbi:MAG: patatin-like phospholipase family protein [Acidimicrobiales bacterium]|nr:patatin-like phospholipase family protein [Acidimicrobiales bacterium]
MAGDTRPDSRVKALVDAALSLRAGKAPARRRTSTPPPKRITKVEATDEADATADTDPPGRPTVPEGPAVRRRVAALLLPLVVVGVAAGLISLLHLDTQPGQDGVPDCAVAHDDDTLVELGWKDEAGAEALLARWDACDDQLRDDAVDALDRDNLLIAWLVVGSLVGCGIAMRYRRWRTAAKVGVALTAVYVLADLYENHLLRELLTDGRHHEVLPTVAAVKLGALAGAGLVLLVAASLLAGGNDDDLVTKDDRDPRGAVRSWLGRRFDPRAETVAATAVTVAPAPRATGDTGISCSGGGIRSAAFSLGALQALDDEPSVVAPARWITAVSGGSYMATAWVTARDQQPDATPRPWERRSPEEDHLRRHASYLAPGLGGKLWALTRFILGFAVNLGAVVAFLAVVAVTGGWLISTQAEPQGIGGTVALVDGGCLDLPSGEHLVTIPGQTVRLDGDQAPIVGDGAATPPDKATTSKAKAEVEGTGSATISVESGKGSGSAFGPIDLPLADACSPRAVESPDGVPADAAGHRLSKGTKVPLAVTPQRSVDVEGRVAGCRHDEGDDPAVETTNACSPGGARYVDLPAGSRLVEAASAVLTLDHSALVEGTKDARHLVKACGHHVCVRWELPTWLRWTVLVPLLVGFALGLDTIAVRRSDAARRRREHQLRLMLGSGVALALVGWMLPTVVLWLVHWPGRFEDRLAVASGGGTLALLAALLSQITAAAPKSDASTSRALGLVKRAATRLRPVLVKLAARIVGPAMVIGIALAFFVMGADGYEPEDLLLVLVLGEALLVLGLGGDLNEWSLHPFYREQLRGAFAVDFGAERSTGETARPPRDDPLDRVNRTPGPELVICATANIADDRLTAPGRPAVSWTFTHEGIGSTAFEAAARAGTYKPEKLGPQRAHLASAWTAVAVSGAAFSPAMGKMTRGERMLLALGNLRLGVWYPNPRYHQDHTPNDPEGRRFDMRWYRTHHPRPWYLAKEALGLHRLRDPWIYVTDGGHYENLGLVELLRRGCTEIYCFDAAGDTTDTFGTLSDAMRIARAELEVEIDIRPAPMRPGEDASGISNLGVWPGIVRYADGGVGWLVLSKLTVPRTAPFDIIDLARTLDSFPTHPTADQLYTDQKFEAYRALGHHLGGEARTVGGAIRVLAETYGLSVDDAVALVQQALCAVPDPNPCTAPPPPAE